MFENFKNYYKKNTVEFFLFLLMGILGIRIFYSIWAYIEVLEATKLMSMISVESLQGPDLQQFLEFKQLINLTSGFLISAAVVFLIMLVWLRLAKNKALPTVVLTCIDVILFSLSLIGTYRLVYTANPIPVTNTIWISLAILGLFVVVDIFALRCFRAKKVVKKSVVKEDIKVEVKKEPVKKVVAKKAETKKVAVKKPVAKKPVAKKAVAKKAEVKKAPVKKAVAKKVVAKKTTAKKPAVKKTVKKK